MTRAHYAKHRMTLADVLLIQQQDQRDILDSADESSLADATLNDDDVYQVGYMEMSDVLFPNQT